MTRGVGLFTGLIVLPKVTYATDYLCCKTERTMTEKLIAAVIAKTPWAIHL